MEINLQKIVKIYRVAKTANTVLEQKERLAKALSYQKKGMDTIIDVADVAVRAGKADLDGEDVKNAARAVWNHGPRVYAFVIKTMRKREAR